MTRPHCPICDTEFPGEVVWRNHVWEEHRACHLCGTALDDPGDRYYHWLTAHEDELRDYNRQEAIAAFRSTPADGQPDHAAETESATADQPSEEPPDNQVPAVQGEDPSSPFDRTISRRRLTLGLLGGAGLLAVGNGVGAFGFGGNSSSTGTAVGETAPDFELTATTGETIRLRNGDARPTVLFMMAAWCWTCRSESRALQEVHAQYGEEVRLISIDVDPQRDSMSSLQAFKKNSGGDWPHVMATPKFVQTYRVTALDTTYILDTDDTIVYKDEGATGTDTYSRELQELIAGTDDGCEDES